MKKPTKESPLLADIRLAIGARQDSRFYRINTGVYFALVGSVGAKKLGRVRSAPTGFPDLVGLQRRTVERHEVINPNGFTPLDRMYQFTYGQAIAIEAKTVKGQQSDEQVFFQREWEKVGGVYILARSVEDVLSILGPDRQP